MITVLALDRRDGWVFARDGERIVLLRPPYRLPDARVVSEQVVERAVALHDYTSCRRELASWAEVIAFVRREVAEQRKADGRALPEEGIGRALLKSAPASTVERFLDRISNELLPREEFDAAEKILLAIQIESPRLRESPDLNRQTAELMAEVLKRREERLARHASEENPFRRLARSGRLDDARKYGRLVARAGSMFAGHVEL